MINQKNKIKKFNEDGYIIIKNFLSLKDLKNIKTQMGDILDVQLSHNKIKFNKKSSVDTKYFLLKKKKLS